MSAAIPDGIHANLSSDYVLRSEISVDAGSTAEFELQQIRAAEEAAGRGGFVRGALLRSYSHPAKYVVISSYEDVQAAWALGQGGVPTATRCDNARLDVTMTWQEGYELVHELVSHQPTQVRCELLTDKVLRGPELIPAFETAFRQLFDVRRVYSPGFGFNRLLRSAGRLGRYLVIQGYTDLIAAGEADTAADVQSFIHDHPAHLYSETLGSGEAYAVIARIPGPSPAVEEAI
jgi:hypothetical protein